MAKTTKDKPPLTLDEHKALGRALHEMSDRLTTIAVDLGARYPVRLMDRAMLTHRALTDLRGALEDQLFRETRGEDRGELRGVYFPERATPKEPQA